MVKYALEYLKKGFLPVKEHFSNTLILTGAYNLFLFDILKLEYCTTQPL